MEKFGFNFSVDLCYVRVVEVGADAAREPSRKLQLCAFPVARNRQSTEVPNLMV